MRGPVPAVVPRNDGRRLPMLFFGSVLAIYLVLGYGIYSLIAALF